MSQEAMKKIKSFADEMKQETKADYYSSWILIYAYARFLMQDQETVLADITEEAQKKEVKDVFQKARDMKLQPSQMADAMRLLLLDNAFSAKKDVCVLYARQVEKTLPSMRGCFRKLVDAYGPLFSAFCKDYDLNAVVTAIKETYDPLDKKSPIAVKDLSAQNEGTHDSDQPAAEPAVESSSPVKSPEETAATPPTDAASAISDISKMPKDGKKRGKGDDKGTTEAEKEVQSQSQRPDKKLDALSLVCRDLYAALSNTVLGQADAIRFFVKGYFQSELLKGSSQNQNKPKAVFLFAGPPGVGKTFLAEEAAKQLKKAVLRLNMSEYADHQAHLDLIGTSKKFSGSDNGNLTLFVRQHPDGIIIFDEIDTGVSGKVAEKMAQIMQEMGNNDRQVISITHLPQIAALGTIHYKVTKEETRQGTTSRMAILSAEGRVKEIAQMLSGSNITKAAIDHAKELLNIETTHL